MSATRGLLLALGLCAAFLAPACSRAHAPGSSSEVVGAQSHGPAGALVVPSLFDRVPFAQAKVSHQGTRRLTYDYEFAGAKHTMLYEERVTTDGHGRFAIDPLRVAQPALSAAQNEVFLLVQKQREGFFERYRDFGVRERALFLQNYRVTDLRTNPTVVGRACVEFEVERVTGASSTYRIAIDSETALVLRSVELAPDGHEMARQEYVDFTLDPNTNGVEWHMPQYEGVPLESTSIDPTTFGANPAQPALLPAGYQSLHAEVLREENVPWIRRVYGDGVETMFVLQRAAVTLDEGGADSATRATRGGRAESGDPARSGAPQTYTIRVFAYGPWTVAECSRAAGQIFVIGKLPEAEILRVLESAI